MLWLLAALAQPPTGRHVEFAAALDLPALANVDDWRVAHTETFIQQCPAHASFIVGEGGKIGGEAADRVTDFRRMLGVGAEQGGDNVADLLADYAELVRHADNDERAQHARAAMLWEHLLSWITPYLDSVVRSAPAPYAQWANLTRDVLYLEAETLSPPARLPLHLRVASAVTNPLQAESADRAVDRLLAPINSGVVLTRADLARAPAALSSAGVQCSRAATVKHLLEQDGETTLAWLAQEARDQARARAQEQNRLGDVAVFWSKRAAATAEALAAMANQLGEPGQDNTSHSRAQLDC